MDSEGGLEEEGAEDTGTGAAVGAEADAGQLMTLGGLEEEVEGGDAAEQGGAEEAEGTKRQGSSSTPRGKR